MSIDIAGNNPSDRPAESEVTILTGRLCEAQGMSAGTAYTAGSRAGQYAVEVTFTALREIGVIPEEGIDIDAFNAAARRIVDLSIRPRIQGSPSS